MGRGLRRTCGALLGSIGIVAGIAAPASAALPSVPQTVSSLTGTVGSAAGTVGGLAGQATSAAGSATSPVVQPPPPPPVVTNVTTAVSNLLQPTTSSLPPPIGSGGSKSPGSSSGPGTVHSSGGPGGSSGGGSGSNGSNGSNGGPGGSGPSASGGGRQGGPGTGAGSLASPRSAAAARARARVIAHVPLHVAPLAAAHVIPARANVASHSGRDPFTGSIGTIVRVIPNAVKVLIGVLILLALGFALRSRLARRRARRLERQRRELIGDLGLLQRALLPDIADELPDLAVSVAYRPADGPAAGGDFYDVFALDDKRTAIIVGDVMGHGRAALAVTALMRYSLRAYLSAGLEPRVALKVAGQALEGDPDGELTTVVVAVHDPEARTLTYACAGHEPPIVVGSGSYLPVTLCSAPPIGGFMETGQRQTVITVAPGTRICFFTDGLVEARVADGLMGRETLERFVGEVKDAERLLERVATTAERTPDDMAACIVTPLAGLPDEPPRRVEELEMNPSELTGKRLTAFLTACSVPEAQIKSALDTARAMISDGEGCRVRVTIASGATAVEVLPLEPGPVTIPSLERARRRARLALSL